MDKLVDPFMTKWKPYCDGQVMPEVYGSVLPTAMPVATCSIPFCPKAYGAANQTIEDAIHILRMH